LWQGQPTLQVSAKTVIAGHVEQFEAQIAPELRTASLDFVEVAKGNAVPVYPKYWEIQIDLEQRTIS
jgi:adenylate cyclase